MKKFLSAGEAENRAREIQDDIDELNALAEEFLSQEEIVGSPNGFHNFSINYSRNSDYETACKILTKGLELHPYNVDLLSDFLNCGMNCSMERIDQCAHYFDILLSISRSVWTWRGFSFSIDYIISRCDHNLSVHDQQKDKELMLDINEEYIKLFPDNEDAWITRADIHKYFNERDKEIETLKSAISCVKSCAKIALRYADILFGKGEYKEAMKMINKCIMASATTQPSISLAYVYYLSGLCKLSLLFAEIESKMDPNIVEDIYRDFCIARENKLGHTYYLVTEKQIRILEIKTGIKYDEVTSEL